LKKFKATHLEVGGWYLDCNWNYTLDSKVVERTTLDSGKLPLVDPNDVQEVSPKKT